MYVIPASSAITPLSYRFFVWVQSVAKRFSFVMLRGFVKLKKFKKSEKNSEVGGWVKPQLGFQFFFVNDVLILHYYNDGLISTSNIDKKTNKQRKIYLLLQSLTNSHKS